MTEDENAPAANEWVVSLDTISRPEVMSSLAKVMIEESSLIIEHRFYRGAREPFRFICSDPDEFRDYVGHKLEPGDSVWIWKFEDCCTAANSFTRGKFPNAAGLVPKGGAY